MCLLRMCLRKQSLTQPGPWKKRAAIFSVVCSFSFGWMGGTSSPLLPKRVETCFPKRKEGNYENNQFCPKLPFGCWGGGGSRSIKVKHPFKGGGVIIDRCSLLGRGSRKISLTSLLDARMFLCFKMAAPRQFFYDIVVT